MSNKDKKKAPKLGEVISSESTSNSEHEFTIKLTDAGEEFINSINALDLPTFMPRNAVVQGNPTIGRV